MKDDYDHNPENDAVENFVDAATLDLGEVWDYQAGTIVNAVLSCLVAHLEQAASEALQIKPLSRGGTSFGVVGEKGGLSL